MSTTGQQSFCDNCGAARVGDAKFCRECGQPYAAQAPPQPAFADAPAPNQWGDTYTGATSAGGNQGFGGASFGGPTGPSPQDRVKEFFVIGDPVRVTPERADWGTRAVAALIDGGVGLGIFVALYVVAIVLRVVIGAVVPALGILVFLLLVLLAGAGQIGFLIWNSIRQGRTGQTFGKEKMKIAAVQRVDGNVMGAGQAVGRQIIPAAISGVTCGLFGLLDALWPLWDPDSQAIHDKFFNTIVVKAAE